MARDTRPRREEPRRPVHLRARVAHVTRTTDEAPRRPRAHHPGSSPAKERTVATRLYDPRDTSYAEPSDARAERDRTFQICSDCRICVRFCPSFKDLLRMIDEREDGARDVTFLTEIQHTQVVDECYQCKLCFVICPYTPGRGQDWKIDFPRL